MELPARLYITEKGVDEVKRRTHKLGMKKRSVLILLDTPKSLAQILYKSVFPEAEVRQEISELIEQGFIGAELTELTELAKLAKLAKVTKLTDPPRAAAPPAMAPVTGAGIEVGDEIILSEAKFLLTDFTVDSFGTQSQVIVDAIRACKGVSDFRSCLNAILAAVEKRCPAQLPALRKLVEEINATA